MRVVSRTASFVAILVLALAGAVHAAPQIVAAVPSNGPINLICDGAECWAELSTICLQKTRFTPRAGTSYVIHRPHRTAIAVIGHRGDGKTIRLASDVLHFASLRGQTAFRVLLPTSFQENRGLDRVSISVEQLATLIP